MTTLLKEQSGVLESAGVLEGRRTSLSCFLILKQEVKWDGWIDHQF
jgi:hypothetical protein